MGAVWKLTTKQLEDILIQGTKTASVEGELPENSMLKRKPRDEPHLEVTHGVPERHRIPDSFIKELYSDWLKRLQEESA
jgi:hypothetical protein